MVVVVVVQATRYQRLEEALVLNRETKMHMSLLVPQRPRARS